MFYYYIVAFCVFVSNIVCASYDDLSREKRPLQIVLAGAPGVGKTTLWERLIQSPEYCGIPEAATDYIKSRQAQGVEKPWEEGSFTDFCQAIAQLCLKRRSEAQQDFTLHSVKYLVFDRSELDVFSFLAPPYNDFFLRIFEQCQQPENRYDVVFYLEPLDTCETNAIRRENLEESRVLAEKTKAIYSQCGYTVISVGKMSVEKRVAFVLEEIAKLSNPFA